MKRILLSTFCGLVLCINACQSERQQKLETLQKMGFKNESPFFFKAASKSNLEALVLFKTLGMDIDQKDKGGNTALVVAANKGNVSVVKKLIELGANPTIKGGTKGLNAIVDAASLNNLEVVRAIIETKSLDSTKATPTIDGKNAMLMASGQGFLSIVEYLASHDEKLIHAKNNSKIEAILLAVQSGHQSVVEFLANNGANINAADKDGNTCLKWAEYSGYPKVARFLRSKGAKK